MSESTARTSRLGRYYCVGIIEGRSENVRNIREKSINAREYTRKLIGRTFLAKQNER